MPFEDISDSKAINFLKSLKVYKLTRFLWLHVITKLKELGLYQSIKRINQYNPPRNIKLEQVYAEKKVTTLNEELLRLKKAIELNPGNDRAYVELGNIYCTQNKFFEVRDLFKKAIGLNLVGYKVYAAYELLCKEMGDLGLARECGKKIKEQKLGYYTQSTVDNYNKLKAILDERGVTYVCVQYPMRDALPLKRIFQGNVEDIIFVDNKKIFEDAVVKYGYQKYFKNMFDGDFGHCIPNGNRLLAKNIASTILKEVFGK